MASFHFFAFFFTFCLDAALDMMYTPIMVTKYSVDLKREREILAGLLREREETEIKIARQKKRVAALAELCEESEFAEQAIDLNLGGLTDVCRTAMRAARKEWMSIAEIQETVSELGFPLNQYKAPAASITTTVNRLVDAGEVEAKRG